MVDSKYNVNLYCSEKKAIYILPCFFVHRKYSRRKSTRQPGVGELRVWGMMKCLASSYILNLFPNEHIMTESTPC